MKKKTLFLHDNNAPAHSELSIREFLADKKKYLWSRTLPILLTELYVIFFLFPRLKSAALKEQRFRDV